MLFQVERLGKLEEEAKKSRGWFSGWWYGGSSKDGELAEGTAISKFLLIIFLLCPHGCFFIPNQENQYYGYRTADKHINKLRPHTTNDRAHHKIDYTVGLLV